MSYHQWWTVAVGETLAGPRDLSAEYAEEVGSLALLDRLAYDNPEPLIALAVLRRRESVATVSAALQAATVTTPPWNTSPTFSCRTSNKDDLP